MLIGSRAIKYHFSDFPREPKDWDYATNSKSIKPFKDQDFINIPQLVGEGIATPDQLYTLKLSHIFWNKQQEKHLSDLIFLKRKGCKKDEKLFDELYKHWNQNLGENKRVDYEKSNDSFFDDDAVVRPIEHDELHRIINPNPLYLLIKPDQTSANISKEMFFNLPKEIQLELCREEAYVLALERFVVFDKKMYWREGYTKMLRAMIMRLSPLWFGTYVAENYDMLRKPTFNFEQKFKQKQNEQKY